MIHVIYTINSALQLYYISLEVIVTREDNSFSTFLRALWLFGVRSRANKYRTIM